MNQSVELLGLKFWASPATPTYHDWAFNCDESQIEQLWAGIPHDTHVVITHGPPQYILDQGFLNNHLGCPYLRTAIEKNKPQLHLFGHVHESAGIMENKDTLFVNSATCVYSLEIDGSNISYKLIKK